MLVGAVLTDVLSLTSTLRGTSAAWAGGCQQRVRQQPRRLCCRASDERRVSLDRAATSFAKGVLLALIALGLDGAGLQSGADPDDLVAEQMGAGGASQLTEVQERYKGKVKAVLTQRAEQLQREQEARCVKFTLGKRAYERGQYPQSAALLESALNEEGPFSKMGGDIQMWLALAYQACGREEECIATYKALEASHPLPAIRRQAANLRYIIEAPKLELGEDERVQIPVLTELELNRGSRQPMAPRPRPPLKPPQRPKTWDEEFWINYRPPVYLANRYVWVAAAVVATGLAWYSAVGL